MNKIKTFQLLLFLVLCSYSSLFAESKPDSLRLGVILPLSGDFANYGIAVSNAMQLANEQLPGASIKIIFEDHPTCQASEAITAYHKLTEIDKIDSLVTFCTAAAQAVLPLAKSKKLPLIQLSESGPDPENYMIKIMPDAVAFIDHLAEMLISKYMKIALIANTMEANTGERGNLTLFKNAFEKLGGTVVFSTDFPDSELDFRTLILRLKTSEAEAILPFIWPVDQMIAFLTQAEQLQLWSTKKLAGSFVFEFMFEEIKAAYPKILQNEGLESVNFKNTTSQKFINDYQERFNTVPPQFADYAYDAIAVIKRCGSDRSCQLKSFNGASGFVEFSKEGRRIGEFQTKELRDGIFQALN